jgi:hypothetical protein
MKSQAGRQSHRPYSLQRQYRYRRGVLSALIGLVAVLLAVGMGGFAPSFNEVNDQTRRDLTKAELIAFPALAILRILLQSSRYP